ncbi:MAG: endopeptidase La [Muribaculaceae bacterium]|nr:endopeptidase La [Muribaculaceae bacterium]
MMDFFKDTDNDSIETRRSGIVPIVTEIKLDAIDEDQKLEDTDLTDLPILALRDLVLFPTVTIPVPVGRKKSLQLVKDAQKSKSLIGVVCQVDSAVDDPAFKDLYSVGVFAEIIKVLEMPDGTTNVILQGKGCFNLVSLSAEIPYLRGNVVPLQEIMPAHDDEEFSVLITSLHELVSKMLNTLGEEGKDMFFALKNIDNPLYLVNFLCSHFPFEAKVKQELLEKYDFKKRVYELYAHLSKEAQLIAIRADIQSKTREDISQQQREHFLQQQIRTIQEELGDNFDHDIEELQTRAESKMWTEEVEAVFNKELRKLERLNPQSPDYSVQYNYLDTILNLPWGETSQDVFDLNKAERQLNKDHFGLENVKDRILEHLAVLMLRKDFKSPIICLYGPPGVGKTSLGRSIAKALNREYVRVSLGGLHDEAEIRGHRRTYIGAMPGRIIQGLIKAKTANPVFVLDEIDKLGQDFKGDPSSALLEVLDPEQNIRFHDNFIDMDFDLSEVFFIATANTLSGLQQPLLDRMELIDVSGYIIEEKIEIARKHLLPKQLSDHGFEKREISFSVLAIRKIVESYTRESGVRELDKKIAKILRKIARLKVSGKTYPTKVTPKEVREFLGAEEYASDMYQGNQFLGVVTGLAWTAVGGEILFVESSLSKGKGEKLTLTGNLGDVMKESAVIALQYLKANAETFGIDSEKFDAYNVHIHVPEGAIPKDGPSAGVTMLTSLASIFTGKKVRANLAMTGEITLRGKVLPVGGIKEKILAAKRAGITDIILCKENKKDIDDIKPQYLTGLSFHYVDTVKDVIDFALIDD